MRSGQRVVEYRVYGHKLVSTHAIPGLRAAGVLDSTLPMLTVSATISNEEPSGTWKISWRMRGTGVELFLGDNAKYSIYPDENRIEVWAKNWEVVSSTVINLPCALLFALQGKLLLHASGLVVNQGILAFSGGKGVGKSTVTAALNRWYPLFSDDTILVTRDESGAFKCFSGLRAIRMNADSYRVYTGSEEGFDRYCKNLQGKAIVDTCHAAEDAVDGVGLVAVMALTRGKVHDVLFKKVSEGLAKKLLLHACVTGTGTLGYMYDELVEANRVYRKLCECVPTYRVVIPDGLEEVPRVAGKIRDVVEQCFVTGGQWARTIYQEKQTKRRNDLVVGK